jgi:hypothetical protein
MSRYTNAEMRSIVKPIATKLAEGISEGLMQYLSEADLDLGKAKTKTTPPKVVKTKVELVKGTSRRLAVGLAELADAVEIHKEDFDHSVLAEEARKRFNGKCGMWSICMTWAILNKNPEVKKWAEPKTAKQLRKWYNAL